MATEHYWLQAYEQATVKYLGLKADGCPMPPPPQVPSNVTQVGLPTTGASVEVDGATLDYLPIAFYCNRGNFPMEIENSEYPIIGYMTADGKMIKPHSKVNCDSSGLCFVEMLDPKSNLGIGTKIKQTLYWGRVTQSWVPAETPHTTTTAVTSGITETESTSLSFSIGGKVGFSKVITGEVSAALTQSFGYQISITQQQTVTEQFPFPEKPVQQVVGIYQLMQTFTIYAGANLTDYVANLNKIWKSTLGDILTLKVEMPFTYPTASYMQIAGTDSPVR